MDYHKFLSILRGNYDNIPKKKSKVVRIFLSSTFSDTHVERDYLIENIYPRLNAYCKTTYGLDFQILDMRWGISNEITNAHLTTTICLNEIKNCQKYSIGPNFIALLSHRYGARCLPTRIIAKEYEIFRNEINSNRSDYDLKFEFSKKIENSEEEVSLSIENLFEYCYELDENEIPARFKLKHLDKIFTSYNFKNPVYGKIWSKCEKKLGNLLRKLAEVCLKKKLINQVEYERYFVSVTEKEIFNGILSKGKNLPNNVLYFQRDIENIYDENVIKSNPNLVKKFVDLNNNNKIDTTAKKLLDDLKENKIPSKLTSSNCFKFSVKWCPETGISLKSHSDYVKEFGETFYEQVKLLIDRNQQEVKKIVELNKKDMELLQEVLDHANFCNDTVGKFHGREDLLNEVKRYILNYSTVTPLVVYGNSGCGKTAILAKLTSEIPKFVEDPENYSIILRFLGTTPQTSTIEQVFNSIFYQIAKIYNIKPPHKQFTTHSEIKEYLTKLSFYLFSEYPHRKLVIILDSIDQLTESAYALSWVQFVLPFNLKMVYSIIPNHSDLLGNFLRFEHNLDQKINQIEVKSLNKETALEILRDWLKKDNRRLSEKQYLLLSSMFDSNGATLYPLYVKIIFDIISKWPSFYEPDAEFLQCKVIDDCIKYLFKSLENLHGRLLFSRCIFYMTAFKNGISESELEDLLSLDDDVLYDIFEYHAPPVRKIPISLWSRIKHDLASYLVEKEIQNTRVIYWYHRRFIEVSNSFYISKLNNKEKEVVFSNIIDLFNETWKYKPKPFKYNEYVAKKKNLTTTESEECRNTSVQPTFLIDPVTRTVNYNKRKLIEMPQFISGLTSNLAIPFSCKNMYFNYHFLTGLVIMNDENTIVLKAVEIITRRGLHVINDETRKASHELRIFLLFLMQSCLGMKSFPKSSVSLLLSRCLKLYGVYNYFTQLIDQYDTDSILNSALILTNQITHFPNKCFIFSLADHNTPIKQMALQNQVESHTFTISSNRFLAINFFTLARMVDLKIKNLFDDDEVELMQVYYDKKETSNQENSLTSISGGLILATYNEIRSFRFDLLFNKHYLNIKFDKSIEIENIYMISPNHLLVSFKSQNYISIYNIHTNELIQTIKLESNVEKTFSNVDKSFIFMSNEDSRKYLMIQYKENSRNVASLFRFDYDSKSLTDNKDFDLISMKKVLEIPKSNTKRKVLKICFNKEDIKKILFKNILIIYDDLSIQVIEMPVNSNQPILENIYLSEYESKQLLKREGFKKSDLKILKIFNSRILLTDSENFFMIHLYDGAYKAKFVNPKINNIYACLIFKLSQGTNYDNATFVDNEKIVAFSKGTMTVFILCIISNDQQFNFYSIKACEIKLHYDYVTKMICLDKFLVTNSLDTTLRINQVADCIGFFNEKISNQSKTDILDIKLIESSNFILIRTKDSNELLLYDQAAGDFCDNFKIGYENEFEIIEDCFLDKNQLFIISRSGRDKGILSVRGYILDSNKSKTDNFLRNVFKLSHKIKDHQEHKYRILANKFDDFNIVCLTEPVNRCEIFVYHLNFDECVRIKSGLVETYQSLINLINEIIVKIPNKYLLDQVCLTNKNSLLVLFYDSCLYFINSKKAQLISQFNLALLRYDLDYFLSPTNLQSSSFFLLESIKDNYDAILSINNQNQLVFIEYDLITKIITKQITTNNAQIKYETFKINKNIACTMTRSVEKSSTISRILFYDLLIVRKLNSLSSSTVLFELNFEEEQINLYGLSENNAYFYVVINQNILNFYKIVSIENKKIDLRLISEMMLPCRPNMAICDEDFICLVLQDQSVISFLIADQDDMEASLNKIKSLPRRNILPSEETKKKYELFLNEIARPDDQMTYIQLRNKDELLKEYIREQMSTYEGLKEHQIDYFNNIKNSTKLQEPINLMCISSTFVSSVNEEDENVDKIVKNQNQTTSSELDKISSLQKKSSSSQAISIKTTSKKSNTISSYNKNVSSACSIQ